MILTINPSIEIDLKRITDKHLGDGQRYTWEYESMVEHLILEEARRLNVADKELEADE